MLDGYRADDRRDEDEGEDEGEPVTASGLAIMWAERDARYATLTRALDPDQIESIRVGRLAEASRLPVKERGKAGMNALAWYPPVHGQGGAA